MPASTNPKQRSIEKWQVGRISFAELMAHYIREIDIEFKRRHPRWLAEWEIERKRQILIRRLHRTKA